MNQQAAVISSLEDYEKINPICSVEVNGQKLQFLCPASSVKWRVDTLYTKEPDTIDWLNNMKPGEIMVDVGANMGLYSLYAAKIKSVKTFSFEPEAHNYYLINRNVYLNNLMDLISPFCLAISDQTKFDRLYLSQPGFAGSCHTFGDNLDFHLNERVAGYSQPAFSTTLDELVSSCVIPSPNYLKIDVDGIEHKVIHGAKETLKSSSLESILVELNTNLSCHRELIHEIISYGFSLDEKSLEISIRKSGPFAGVGNHVFRR